MCHRQRASILSLEYTVSSTRAERDSCLCPYLVERTFSESLALPGPHQEAQARLTFIDNNIGWSHLGALIYCAGQEEVILHL